MAGILRRSRALGVAEVMDFPSVIAGDPDVLAKVALHPHVDGHAPGVLGRELDADAGGRHPLRPRGDDVEEALEKRRRGIWVLLREASNARNLTALLELVRRQRPEASRRPGTRRPRARHARARGPHRRDVPPGGGGGDRAGGRAGDGDVASGALPWSRRPRRDRARLPSRPRRARGPRFVPRRGRDRRRRRRGPRRRGAAVRGAASPDWVRDTVRAAPLAPTRSTSARRASACA